jgi:hypothetical protein
VLPGSAAACACREKYAAAGAERRIGGVGLMSLTALGANYSKQLPHRSRMITTPKAYSFIKRPRPRSRRACLQFLIPHSARPAPRLCLKTL